jgi:hypothetical protein
VDHNIEEKPLSQPDITMLRILKARAWFRLIRVYGVLFLAMAFTFYRGYFIPVVGIFALFFTAVFGFFLVRDYLRLITPLRREIRKGIKKCFRFEARKYEDPVFGRHLFFYPGKDNYFIDVTADDFNATQNAEILDLEVSYNLGEVLLLKSSSRIFRLPSEFRFTEDD